MKYASVKYITTPKFFTKSLDNYNKQSKLINNEIKTIVVQLKTKKNDEYHHMCVDLQDKIEMKRIIMNRKKELYEMFDMKWDEDFH